MAERKMPSLDDYPSNADGYKPPAKREEVKPIAHVRKRNEVFTRVRDEFVSEDAGNVGGYILYDVLIPAFRDLILDVLHGSIDMTIGGGAGYRRGSYSRGPSRSNARYAYEKAYDDRNRGRSVRQRDDRPGRRRLEDYESFIFDDRDYRNERKRAREVALEVLDYMCDYIDEYGCVPVSYFYDRVGETMPHDFIGDDWGWTNLASAHVVNVGPGRYSIDFPRLERIG